MQVIGELLAREDRDPAERTSLLRRLIELDPGDQDAHVNLIAHLAACGRRDDANAQAEISRRMLADTGELDQDRLKLALRGTGGRATAARVASVSAAAPKTLRQEIRFCTASDGVRIAYATVGSGPPLVKTAKLAEPSRI
jgi:hypothetical protein